MKKELIIGSGSSRDKRLTIDGTTEFSNPTFLDYNKDHKPDIIWDLTVLPYPMWSNEFDEIHAYEVLEHTGQQGDYKFFFGQFSELWRCLKPNGHLMVTCPSRHSPWALGDPSHTRILQKEMLVFLSQDEYKRQVGVTPMSDFRYIYKADFEPVYVNETNETFEFILRAIKENT